MSTKKSRDRPGPALGRRAVLFLKALESPGAFQFLVLGSLFLLISSPVQVCMRLTLSVILVSAGMSLPSRSLSIMLFTWGHSAVSSSCHLTRCKVYLWSFCFICLLSDFILNWTHGNRYAFICLTTLFPTVQKSGSTSEGWVRHFWINRRYYKCS